VHSRDKTQEQQNVSAKTSLQKEAEKTHKRILTILSEQLGVKETELSLESTMADHGGDSLDAVEIIMALEEEFEVEITDCEMDKIKTPRQVVALILPKIHLPSLSFDDAYIAASELEDIKPTKKKPADKKPALKKVVLADGATLVPGESRKRHLDDLFEYTMSDSAMMEFVKAFNTVFSNSESAYLYASRTPNDSDAWRIQMTTRLSGEAVDAIARFVEDAGFSFVKSTEHTVRLHGSNHVGIVTAIHLSLTTYGL
jgi:acyl carrier protein